MNISGKKRTHGDFRRFYNGKRRDLRRNYRDSGGLRGFQEIKLYLMGYKGIQGDFRGFNRI